MSRIEVKGKIVNYSVSQDGETPKQALSLIHI